ncbi:MAG: family 16 glycosylhydrolase [Sphingobacteriales bacterium]|nr:family 16 glycosylhydrolase [Sphingobacteriales bacterium]
MTTLKNILPFLLFSVLLMECSKKKDSTPTPPTNLNVTATVNPDNSGNVSFVVSATNAASYEIDFGDGFAGTISGTSVTHKYYSSGDFNVTVTATSASGKSVSKTISVTVTVVLKLVWSDEFDTPGSPDNTKWGYDIGTGSGGWGNNELEYYTNRTENVSISGGTLKINLLKESYSGSSYTSARMLTKDKYSFKYGKIEVKAKLPAGVGTWPAIWMLGDNINTAGWPGCGEIDIMEHVGKTLNTIYSTLHYPGHSGANGSGSNTTLATATTDFHRYGLEWTPFSLKFSIDDNVFYTFTNLSSYPFNQNFFIILNVAMGGNFGGPVDPAITSATMEVDYVRVYQQ